MIWGIFYVFHASVTGTDSFKGDLKPEKHPLNMPMPPMLLTYWITCCTVTAVWCQTSTSALLLFTHGHLHMLYHRNMSR